MKVRQFEANVKMRRCEEAVKMRNVKVRICEYYKMRRFEDKKV